MKKHRVMIADYPSGDLSLALEMLRRSNIHGVIAAEHRVNVVDDVAGATELNFSTPGADGQIPLPMEFPLLRFGLNKSMTGQDEMVTAHSGKRAVSLQKAMGKDLILDIEHKSVHSKKGEEFPIALHFNVEDRGADGIWARVLEWTAHGIKAVREKGYKYISPYVLKVQDTGEVVGILSAALTHDPDFVNPPNIFVPHSGGMESAREIATRLLEAETHTTNKEEETMLPKWLLESLGLDEKATDDQIKAAFHSKRKPEEKIVEKIPSTVITALGLKDDASVTEIVGSIHSLKGTAAGAGDLAKRLALLEGKSTEAEGEKLISQAHSAGKLTESMVEWANKEVKEGRINQLRGFLAGAPVIVPQGQRKALTAVEHAAHGRSDGAAVLDDAQREVNKQLGISDAKFTKHFTGSAN